MNDMTRIEPGSVLFLERPVAGLPYATGVFVLVHMTQGAVVVALVSQDERGLYGIDNTYTISTEDITNFTATGEKARVRK